MHAFSFKNLYTTLSVLTKTIYFKEKINLQDSILTYRPNIEHTWVGLRVEKKTEVVGEPQL